MQLTCHGCECENERDLEGEIIAASIGKINSLRLSFGKNSLFVGLFGNLGRSILEIMRTGVISAPEGALDVYEEVPLLPGMQIIPHWVGPGQTWNEETEEWMTLVACAENKKIMIETYWGKGKIAFGQLSYQGKEQGESLLLSHFQPEGIEMDNILSCDSVRFCPSPLYGKSTEARLQAVS